jgi:hypothetical protein
MLIKEHYTVSSRQLAKLYKKKDKDKKKKEEEESTEKK